MPEHELDELTMIYANKGLPHAMAREVAEELTKNNALATHLAEELGITGATLAKPIEAAVGSAGAFTFGAAIPLITIAIGSAASRMALTLTVVTLALIGLGYTSARFGKASTAKPILRVVVGGLVAMGITMAVGKIFGAAVA